MNHRCPNCGCEYFYTLEHCPHCSYKPYYANVLVAAQDHERAEVEARYAAALRDADTRGTRVVLGTFETWLGGCCAVISRSLDAIEQLARNDRTGYASFYELTQAGLRLPDGSDWNTLRLPADQVLFPQYADKIRFGALSGDGVGVINYGSFSLSLRTPLIAERTTVFGGNSAAFVIEHKLKDAAKLLPGHRAPWADRAKLVVAHVGERVADPPDFPRVLIHQGRSTDDDRFVEVQVWGSMTVRTIEKVVYLRNPHDRRVTPSRLAALARDLARFDTALEHR